jgi:hypothetical protein
MKMKTRVLTANREELFMLFMTFRNSAAHTIGATAVATIFLHIVSVET